MVIQTFGMSSSNPYASKTFLLESVKGVKSFMQKIALMRNIIKMIYTHIRWRLLEKAILFMGWVARHFEIT